MGRVLAAVAARVGLGADGLDVRPVGGGSIATSFRIANDERACFVKTAPGESLDRFAAEAEGLSALRDARALRVPDVLAVGTVDRHAFLALEWIDFGQTSRAADAELGERLAWQHRVSAHAFGWHRDNVIGATPQANGWLDDWLLFWRLRRLEPQIELAQKRGAPRRTLDRALRLVAAMAAFFTSHRPVPSLLHGDLWGGNWAVDRTGRPLLFDPAVYFGDRETDIAMTRLFGGFGPAFYSAYHATWPLDAAAGYRRDLYNLYHVLNHYNLFGRGYLAQAEGMIERLLAELGG
jgi:protein-ribulosamine 3-kinase